jgi:hypothetical protein
MIPDSQAVTWTRNSAGSIIQVGGGPVVFASGGSFTGGTLTATAPSVFSGLARFTGGGSFTGGTLTATAPSVFSGLARFTGGGSFTGGTLALSNGAQFGSASFPNPDGNAPMYAARAWVNFRGDAVGVPIRGSRNVSSITDHGVGSYTVNLTTPMTRAGSYVASIISAGNLRTPYPVILGTAAYQFRYSDAAASTFDVGTAGVIFYD